MIVVRGKQASGNTLCSLLLSLLTSKYRNCNQASTEPREIVFRASPQSSSASSGCLAALVPLYLHFFNKMKSKSAQNRRLSFKEVRAFIYKQQNSYL